MDYLFPSTIEDAVEARAEAPNGQFIAGGTDLMVIMADQAVPPDSLIDISRIPELRGIKETEEGIEIGPATTLAELATDSRLPLVLVQGLASVGSLQIRNLATVGGNICNASPCGDTLTPLIVLGAVLVLVSPSGRREVAAEEFFTGPKKTILKRGELLAGIKIPRESLSGGSSFLR
jgi:CO/xanthine dehydrogenase FAD-binding subunit